jgi:hypothetical protein
MSTQRPLFEPPKEWNPPQTLPDLSEAKEIAIDLETYDPGIKDTGPGWARSRYCHSCRRFQRLLSTKT